MENNNKIEKNVKQIRQSDSLYHKALNTITQYSMFSCEDSLLVGVSGGPDSVALLVLLIDIFKSFYSNNKLKYLLNKTDTLSPFCIGISHINHCLRGDESDRDEEFVRTLAKKYNLPFHTLKIDVSDIAKEKKLSFEEAARDVRYDFYKLIAKKKHYTKIALGHNSDDNAELVLMNLLRGSGTKGIAGIPPVRDNLIIRPLIEVSREDILKYLKLKQQPYMIDSSNTDTTYLRNRIRHSLIPHLKNEYNPSISNSLNRLSRIMIDENSWMEEETEKIFNIARIKNEIRLDNEIQLDNEFGVDNEIQLDKKTFTDAHPALAKRLVRRAIQEVKGDLKRITLKHINDIVYLISSKSGGSTLHLPDRICIIKSKETINFKKKSRPLRSKLYSL